uniref:Uncharacterized protein n=1 Tax=Arundo donax TaxID=35708 RepID=A0A0A9VCY5_ARUDO
MKATQCFQAKEVRILLNALLVVLPEKKGTKYANSFNQEYGPLFTKLNIDKLSLPHQ